MTAQSGSIFLLAYWTVHKDRHLIIWADDQNGVTCERQLEPRLMRLLCLLADNAGSVLTRDELITALWPRVVVNENSLTRAVSDLRRLLSPPNGSNIQFIQTVPKRGYRLQVLPEACISGQPTFAAFNTADPKSVSNHSHSWIPAIAACLLLTLSVIYQGSLNQGALNQGVLQPAHHITAQLLGDPEAVQSAIQAAEWHDQVITATPPGAGLQPLLTLSQNHPGIWPAADINPAWQFDRASTDRAVIAPGGELIAYVDSREGISHLNFRHMLSPAEPWTAFSTDENIYHIQWSPLDAGLLFTLGVSAKSNDRTDYLRLMLLDLETLTLHELYRREWPAKTETDIQKDTGSLT
jgi:DNA-binding winged helix-turn-helix (wHTH) protein